MEDIEKGVEVMHSKFGIGRVISTEIIQGDKRAKVDFEQAGERVLILKFAKLKIRK